MSKYMKKLMSFATLIVIAIALTGCGGSNTPKAAVETPLWCKSPETINDAGNACELVITACNYPEVADDQGICVMDTGEWRPGANGIDMPTPVYTAAANEVVYYYQLKSGDYTDWGLHAWNNADCNSYSDFDRPDGGTSWSAPLLPDGIDPNFGAYWVMNIIDAPNCAWFIPHNLVTSTQTSDLKVDLSSTATNPTGSFFVLEGYEDNAIFPYPRTFDSLIVPGGASLTCDAPLILNDAGDACIDDPTVLVTFVPGDAVLYLKGSFNGWETNDAYAFSYANNVYTMVATIPASVDPYEFKVADANWSGPTSFGATAGEEDVVIGEGKTLTVTDGQNIRLTVDADTNYQFTFDATNPEAPILTIIPVTYDKILYVKGTMNEWSNALAMTYEGNNIYTSEYTLDPADYEFKIADANWTENTNFGAAAGDEIQELDVAKTLVFGEGIAQNIALTIASAGAYKFILDATNPEAPILTVTSSVPYGDAEMFLKGTMNEWGGVADGFKFSYADNHYTLIAVIPAGNHEFKIADPTWADKSTVGAVDGDGPLVLGEARTMTLPGGNIKLDVAQDTQFKFDLDATDKAAPTLTVTENVPFVGRTMYLKGAMNGWATVDGYNFDYANNIFTLITSIPAGDYEFKIASDGWEDDSTIGGFAGDNTVTVGTPLTVAVKTNGGDQNLAISVPADTLYKFVVDASDPAAVTLTVTEEVPFAGRTMYLKGSMNGWSVVAGADFTNVAGIFSLETTLDAGSYEFKIASEGWEDDSTIGGFPGDTVVTVDTPLNVAVKTEGGTDNLSFTVDATTTYIMKVDATSAAPNVLTISVKP